MDLVITVNCCKITCLVYPGTIHNIFYTNLFETVFLHPFVDGPLEVVLANGEKVETNQIS